MRKKLEPYLDTYVLCKGWIGDWKDINEKRPQRRVFVSKPIIKQPNKDVLFKDLPSSKQHFFNSEETFSIDSILAILDAKQVTIIFPELCSLKIVLKFSSHR